MNIIKSIPQKMSDSLKELGKVQSVSILAMLLALRIILGMFANFQLGFFPYAKLSLAFIPLVIAAYYFGPVGAMIQACLGDILAYAIVPTAASFTPGITAGYMVEALIIGIIYYHEKMSIPRSAVAQVLATLAGSIAINTVFIYAFYGMSYIHLLILRSALLLPWCIVQVFVTNILINALNRVPALKKLGNSLWTDTE